MPPNIWDILSESKRIIKANPTHYLTLTLIFLLPLSFSSLLFQQLLKHFQQQQPPINPTVTLFFSLIFLLFTSVFSFSAVSSITYSVFHDFFRRPVKLSESIKSISTSFFPLLATSTVSFVILSSVFFLSGLVLFLILILFRALHRGVDLKTYAYLVVLCTALLMLVFLLMVTYLQVKWSLAQVIVVVESRWGLEPLRRSAGLVKGMKRVVVSSFLFFGYLQGILGFIIYYLSTTWILILGISPSIAMLMLYYLTVNTVLYIYCKDNHGELAEEEPRKQEVDGVSFPLIP